jgi:hypothetical protein
MTPLAPAPPSEQHADTRAARFPPAARGTDGGGRTNEPGHDAARALTGDTRWIQPSRKPRAATPPTACGRACRTCRVDAAVRAHFSLLAARSSPVSRTAARIVGGFTRRGRHGGKRAEQVRGAWRAELTIRRATETPAATPSGSADRESENVSFKREGDRDMNSAPLPGAPGGNGRRARVEAASADGGGQSSGRGPAGETPALPGGGRPASLLVARCSLRGGRGGSWTLRRSRQYAAVHAAL